MNHPSIMGRRLGNAEGPTVAVRGVLTDRPRLASDASPAGERRDLERKGDRWIMGR